MKGFFLLFSDSAKELKKISTLTVTGMLIAVALVLRVYFSLQITPDVRVTFQFIPVMIIAMLFGPAVGGMSAVSVDFIGYVLSNDKIREYSIPLACVHIISGIIYGLFLYHREHIQISANASKITTLLVCDLIMNSLIIYVSYVNRDFDMSAAADLKAFFVWFSPRAIKSLIELPVDLILINLVLPVALRIYKSVRKEYGNVA